MEPDSGPSRPVPSEPNGPEGLMARVAMGDERAFAGLYDELCPLIFSVVTRVVRDPAQSEEVVQEVFLEIWRLAPRFRAERGSVSGWAGSIAHRRAVDRVRSSEASRRREEADHHKIAVGPTPVDDEVVDRLDRERVRRAMEQLTEHQRGAIELAYDQGRTYREVAVLLDIPEGTAKTRIRDGLIRLRDHLGVSP